MPTNIGIYCFTSNASFPVGRDKHTTGEALEWSLDRNEFSGHRPKDALEKPFRASGFVWRYLAVRPFALFLEDLDGNVEQN